MFHFSFDGGTELVSLSSNHASRLLFPLLFHKMTGIKWKHKVHQAGGSLVTYELINTLKLLIFLIVFPVDEGPRKRIYVMTINQHV